MMEKVSGRLRDMGITLTYEDAALDRIADAGYDPVYGARPIRRFIQDRIENELSRKILSGTLHDGSVLKVLADGGRISVEG